MHYCTVTIEDLRGTEREVTPHSGIVSLISRLPGLQVGNMFKTIADFILPTLFTVIVGSTQKMIWVEYHAVDTAHGNFSVENVYTMPLWEAL